jgi:uncharacterized protein (DUF433 family)
VDEHTYLSETPGVCGGYPVVRGTRTPAWVIVEHYREAGALEPVLAALSHLNREQVKGELDCYARNPARVDEDIARNARALAEWQSRDGRTRHPNAASIVSDVYI